MWIRCVSGDVWAGMVITCCLLGQIVMELVGGNYINSALWLGLLPLQCAYVVGCIWLVYRGLPHFVLQFGRWPERILRSGLVLLLLVAAFLHWNLQSNWLNNRSTTAERDLLIVALLILVVVLVNLCTISRALSRPVAESIPEELLRQIQDEANHHARPTMHTRHTDFELARLASPTDDAAVMDFEECRQL